VHHDSKKFSMKNRRGVSNIIGSLIVLAVVASVGSVILFQGLNQINAFNYDLTLHDKESSQALREDLIFEHVSFEPTAANMTLYIANIGTIDSTITTVTIVKIDTQELILRAQSPVDFPPTTVLIEDHIELPLLTIVLPVGTGQWDDSYYNASEYKISITTSKGNFEPEPTIAIPFNT